MSTLFIRNSHTITHGQVLSGIAMHAKTLHVASGLVWITIEGMADDYWLRGGDTLRTPPGRLIVVAAEKCTSQLDIRPVSARQASADSLARIGERSQCAPAPCSLK